MMTEDTTQFITTLGDGDGIADARIISGGTSFEIVPNVNMSKWDDEAFLNINKKDFIVSKSTLTDFIDDRLILQNSNEKWQTYIKDGKQEIEVVYPDVSSVPNIIELDLLYPDGLNFFYQGPLSQEAIKKGNERPENVVGSYAAYWKEQNNKYKTGKFCHIYAMYFVDAKGSVVKVPYLIENCKIQILPKECAEVSKWLETAYGAITLDPIIGHSSQGASENGVSSGKPEAGKFNSGSNQGDGSVASINIIAKETGGGANASAYCAIYDDNGGEPDTQLTNSYDGVEITGGDSFAAYTITYGTQPTVIAGSTDYWLSVCKGAAGTMQIAFDDGAGTSRHIYNNTDGCDRAVWTTSLDSAGDDKMSIWIVTDEASGGETISIEASVSGVTISQAMDLTVSRALGVGISGNSITSNAGLIVNRSIKGNIQGVIGVSDVELLISEIISIAASILVRTITPEIDLRVARGYVSGISAQTITPM
ncbi:MAG: hypothetical protein JRI86_09435 [Deltaproteobacteria bacterium]|nr:hypothetical protein [Deltaproteobacteria bacterium]